MKNEIFAYQIKKGDLILINNIWEEVLSSSGIETFFEGSWRQEICCSSGKKYYFFSFKKLMTFQRHKIDN